MKAKLIALNASYTHTNCAVRALSLVSGAPFFEGNINMDVALLREQILLGDPDILGFSCYIWNIGLVKTLGRALKRTKPALKIWLGGPEATFSARTLLETEPWIDGVLCGEAEETWPLLLEKLNSGQPPAFPGALYRQNGCIEGDDTPQTVTDLAALPFAYEKGLPENTLVYYESTRGCPFMCAYCLSGRRETVRTRPLPLVEQDLSALHRMGAKIVKFTDRTFNCLPDRAAHIMRFALENTPGMRLHFEVGADLLTEELIDLFCTAPHGAFQIEAGIQSFYVETLAAVCRKTDIEKLTSAVTRIVNAGRTHVHVDLIAGLPFEDGDTLACSFNSAFALNAQMVQLGFLKLLPGSPLAENDDGITCAPDAPYEVLRTQWLSADQIRTARGVAAMTDRYYNNGRAARALRMTAKEQSIFAFLARLSEGERAAGRLYRPLSAQHALQALQAFLEQEQANERVWCAFAADLFSQNLWQPDLPGTLETERGTRRLRLPIDPDTGERKETAVLYEKGGHRI
ncbi:MAG: B12-binding domain-containing radical SAM protein [Clostridia bacterium]|nr:B12-binding domain-containing radical SAM protein [Clostridia bacterium]